MERLRTEQPKGLNRAALRRWGMLFLALGVFGRGILQNRVLGVGGMTSQQLLDAMSGSSDVMTTVTFALILQFVECCAAPVFCLLAAEGMAMTSNAPKYLARVFGVAVISEIPYNFAMTGNLLDSTSRNPVFAMFLVTLLMYLYVHFADKTAMHFLYRMAFTIAVFFWVAVLKIENGLPCLVLTLAFWLFRKKLMVRNLVAGGVAMFCSLYSIFFMAAPMGMILLHFYNGQKEEQENRLVNYLFYPVLLTVIGLAGFLAL
jgi:hypothetical protein